MNRKTRILIVEDDTPVAMMMVHVLARAGYEVQVANTGKKGMVLALESKSDLFVLAVDLPDINGFEICSELKQRHLTRHTPVVFTSGRSCEEERRHSFELGALDYIATPFEATDFIFRITSQAKAKTSSVMVLSRKEAAGLQTMCKC